MSCWTRQSKFFGGEDDSAWLTSQLKFAREQLDGKARFCEQLAQEVRILQADLDARGKVLREVRGVLGSTNAELRAAAQASAAERSELSEEAVALRERSQRLHGEASSAQELAARSTQESEELRRQLSLAERRCESFQVSAASAAPSAADLGAGTGRDYGPMCVEPRGAVAEASKLAAAAAAVREAELQEAVTREREACTNLRDQLQACQDQCVWLQEQRSAAASAAAASAVADAAAELDRLRAECARERELQEDAARQLQALRALRAEEVRELQTDMASMSSGLEQKEEDILSIQFQMVELQNKFKDQAHLVYENADAFQQASEELADKDEKLEKTKVLLTQMKDVSLELQSKVRELSQELESSRAAYQALDEQHRAVVTRLEGDRNALEVELQRVRAEAGAEVATLKEELRRREAASAELRSSLEKELNAFRLVAELESRSRISTKDTYSWHEAAKTDSERIRELQDSERIRELQDELGDTTQRLEAAEAQLPDLRAALERSRLLERQAREQAQEYCSGRELRRDFEKESFWVAAPRRDSESFHETSSVSSLPGALGRVFRGDGPPVASSSCSSLGPEVPDVLIVAELDLGREAGTTAVLSISPSQTRSDFEAAVRDFIHKHRVDPAMSVVLVRFLEELEAQATTFPVLVKASLEELQQRYY